MEKLGAGIAATGSGTDLLPAAGDIKALSDVLHPQYMKDLVLEDGWGRLIQVESSGPGLRFRSVGPDGQRGTPDDIVSPGIRPSSMSAVCLCDELVANDLARLNSASETRLRS